MSRIFSFTGDRKLRECLEHRPLWATGYNPGKKKLLLGTGNCKKVRIISSRAIHPGDLLFAVEDPHLYSPGTLVPPLSLSKARKTRIGL